MARGRAEPGAGAKAPAGRRIGPDATDALSLADAPGVSRLTAEAAAKAPFASVPVARVAAAARAHCGSHYYGLYLQGRKLGWAKMGCAMRRLGGKPVYERRSRMVMHAKMYTTVVKIEMSTLARFAATGKGELLRYEYRQKGVQQRRTVTITRKGDGWHVKQTYRAGTIRKPPTRKVLKQMPMSLRTAETAVSTLLVEGKLQPGATFRFLELDPEDVKVRPSAVRLLASGQRVLRGVKVRVHKLEMLELHRKLSGVTLVDASGNWLDGRLQGTIRIRREEKATAKKVNPKAGDFGLGVVIQARLNVKQPRRVRKLRLRLQGFLPAALSKSPRQKLVRQGPRQAQLTVTRESLAHQTGARLPVPAKRFPEALEATSSIESKHPEIRRLARRVVGAEKGALAAATKLNTFVFHYLRKSLSTNLDSALAISRARAGDCTEHARLLVALCRSIGLPAREVGGVTWVPDLGGFGYHAWTEIWVGRWVTADPSWNELPANATHLHMGGPNDVQWIGTLGDLKIQVLDVKTDSGTPRPRAADPGSAP
jgi:hypothetical protein